MYHEAGFKVFASLGRCISPAGYWVWKSKDWPETLWLVSNLSTLLIDS